MTTPRLFLQPLRVADAEQMVDVLADPALYRFTGGEPPSIQQLTSRYERQVEGRSSDGREQWLNWIVCDHAAGALGFVQATVTGGGGPASAAELAWLVSPAHQGRGIATEAAGAMLSWLRDAAGVTVFAAHIHPDHAGSEAVARHLGLHPTDTAVDGERRWESDRR
ncbi:GNAT family N-acetyltransferase [Subtercola boreus]|uniref:GNAT family N-acetyltransferase n=1 Tax=Subtercola boreus TaxID=120213 RepID=A0A3E0VNV9_9MICO|nr:GNAT family N-acetyltransferase [Subtercola boreus]